MYQRLSTVLRSSKAAIDLASIMVGIIVIGLIGAVIAATVFVVIPWAQVEAQKQQLTNLKSAISVFQGSSLSDGAGPIQQSSTGFTLSDLRNAGLTSVPDYDSSARRTTTVYWCASNASSSSDQIVNGKYILLTFIAGEKFEQVVFMTRDHSPVAIKDFGSGADLGLLYQQACSGDTAYDGLLHN